MRSLFLVFLATISLAGFVATECTLDDVLRCEREIESEISSDSYWIYLHYRNYQNYWTYWITYGWEWDLFCRVHNQFFFISAAIEDCLHIGGLQDIQVKLFNRLSAKSLVVTYNTKKEKNMICYWGCWFNSFDVRSMWVPDGFEIWQREAKSFGHQRWRIFGGRNQADFKPAGCY